MLIARRHCADLLLPRIGSKHERIHPWRARSKQHLQWQRICIDSATHYYAPTINQSPTDSLYIDNTHYHLSSNINTGLPALMVRQPVTTFIQHCMEGLRYESHSFNIAHTGRQKYNRLISRVFNSKHGNQATKSSIMKP